ncbi:transmembrane protein, putative [Medicago truncatula]|uniref:Transmembrane protein, putative n=1 Tax=Medicago truncatula TaxID=3880 RepID=G7IBT0_MEDTR|nr:transmembrane protein, putative [Medicago truncatula]
MYGMYVYAVIGHINLYGRLALLLFETLAVALAESGIWWLWFGWPGLEDQVTSVLLIKAKFPSLAKFEKRDPSSYKSLIIFMILLISLLNKLA